MVISFEIYLLIAAIPILGIAAIGMLQEQTRFGYLHGQGRFVGTSMGLIILIIGLSFFFGTNGYWVGVIGLWLLFIAAILPGPKFASLLAREFIKC